MSQHVAETCNESNGLWLPLIEYSVKSGVSLSTIRRKIKSNSIQYRLEKGRYLILFNEMNNQAASLPLPPVASDLGKWADEPLSRVHQSRPAVVEESFEDDRSIPLVEKAVKMVSDAFEHALNEKEERIRMLELRNREMEDRLSELKTLVRVLEEKYEVRY